MSSDLVESNTSQALSPRRNKAAGVGVPKENFSRKPSLSRMTSTSAAPSPAIAWAGLASPGLASPVLGCGGGSDAAMVGLGDGASVICIGGASDDLTGSDAAGF